MAGDIPIPEHWTKPVCAILRESNPYKIDWTVRAFLEWQAATLSPFHFEAQEAMANALSKPGVVGVKVSLLEVGESYAFWFIFSNIKLYGKICLRPNKLNIKIISAHTPTRGDELF